MACTTNIESLGAPTAAVTPADSSSMGSFGAILGAILGSTAALSEFNAQYMISQDTISQNRSTVSEAASAANVTATQNLTKEIDKYNHEMHKSGITSLIMKIVSVIVAAIAIAISGGVLAGIAIAALTVLMNLPSKDNPIMMLATEIAKGVGDPSAAQWICLGLEVAAMVATMGASSMSDGTSLIAKVGAKMGGTAANIALATKTLSATALILGLGTAATGAVGARYQLDAANIMGDDVAPLEGAISFYNGLMSILSTQTSQQNAAQSAMDNMFTAGFSAQDAQAQTYGSSFADASGSN